MFVNFKLYYRVVQNLNVKMYVKKAKTLIEYLLDKFWIKFLILNDLLFLWLPLYIHINKGLFQNHFHSTLLTRIHYINSNLTSPFFRSKYIDYTFHESISLVTSLHHYSVNCVAKGFSVTFEEVLTFQLLLTFRFS